MLTMNGLARGPVHMILAAALAVLVAVGLAVAGPAGQAAAATGPSVFGRGWNARGEAGTLGTSAIAAPSPLIRLTAPVRQLASDEIQTDESAALLTDGTVDTWGSNAYGGLGDGTTTERDYPAPALGLSGIITQIAVDDGFMLAVGSGGTVWGLGQQLQRAAGHRDDDEPDAARARARPVRDHPGGCRLGSRARPEPGRHCMGVGCQ